MVCLCILKSYKKAPHTSLQVKITIKKNVFKKNFRDKGSKNLDPNFVL